MQLRLSIAVLSAVAIMSVAAPAPAVAVEPQGRASSPDAIAIEGHEAISADVNFVAAFEMWRGRARNEGFNAVEEDVLARAAMEKDLQAAADVAYFYFAMGLYAEAGGVIRAIDPKTRSADLMLLEGIVSLKLRRWGEAAELFSRPALKTLPQAAPWRGIAYAELGAFHEAAIDLLRTGRTAVPFEENAAQFYLAKAHAALAIGHLDPARQALGSIRDHVETHDQRGRRRLLEARLQSARGAESAALNAFAGLQREGAMPVSLHAEIDIIRQRQLTGALALSDALDQLNAMGIRWSGGSVERERLELEAALHGQSGNQLLAVAALRKIYLRFPQSDAARMAKKDIRMTLSTILNDKSVSPREAAKTFYENIDLASPGAAGDALIRDAVHTLAGLDLLAEAAELLRHQVFQRLRGAQRSGVAADLAALYLGAQDPLSAIAVIENTRRTRLPERLAARRDFLEADAHFQNGDLDVALEIIADRESFEALTLKGRLLTALGDLTEAGEAYSHAAFAGDGEPTPAQAEAAILAASVFAQAGNDDALQSLSDKIGNRLAPGPARDLFEGLVALGPNDNDDDFTARYAAYFDG